MADDRIARLRDRPSRAALRAIAATRRRVRADGTRLLLACAPKSGSTFLIEALLELTGFERRNPLAAGYRHENNLYEPALVDALGRDAVAQVHTVGSDHNIALAQTYDWRPIVLVRDLPDAIVSLRDHMSSEGPRWSMLWADERFMDHPVERQLDMLVDLAAPWFINFFVSWSEAGVSGKVDPFFVTYEELTSDPSTTLSDIAAWAGIAASRQEVERALSSAGQRDIRLNAGVAGRGQHRLSDSQRERLHGLTAHYPWIDFSPLGLSRD